MPYADFDDDCGSPQYWLAEQDDWERFCRGESGESDDDDDSDLIGCEALTAAERNPSMLRR